MTRRRRLGVWILALAFAAAAGWWLAHVPYRPARLLDAVPEGAPWVTAHRGLAGRWTNLVANPLLAGVLAAQGLDRADLDEALNDPDVDAWVRRLLSDEVVLAQMPDPYDTSGECWMMASWLGARVHWLRWWINLDRSGDLRRFAEHRGRHVWRLAFREDDAEHLLFFAFDEGLVIACLSDSPADVMVALDAYDGLRPRFDPALAAEAMGPGTGPDRGWARLPGPGRGRAVQYRIDACDAARLEGELRLDAPFVTPVALPDAAPTPLDAAARTLGAAPVAAASADLDAWSAALAPRPGSWPEAMLDAARRHLRGPTVLAVVGDDVSGRLFGMKVPAAVAAAPLRDAANWKAALSAELDRLNASRQWGLIPRPRPVGEVEMVILEGTADNAYARLGESAAFALAERDGWLFAASNPLTLERLLQGGAAAGGAAPPAWARACAVPPGSAAAWMDLDRSARTVRLVLSVVSLQAMMSGRPSPAGPSLSAARGWLDLLSSMDAAALTIDPDGGGLRIRFALGPPP